jgi:phosphotriesterase-related protein
VNSGIVRTVLGDVEPNTLGVVNYHEHLFQVSPLLPGDELDDEQKSGAEAAELHAHGTATIVESTPMGLGRNDEAVARISAATGLHVVHVTGAHHVDHYAEDHPLVKASEDSLTAFFINDITDGFKRRDGQRSAAPNGDPIRAGMIKAAIRYWAIGPFERRVLAAAARAHEYTGAPVMVHTAHGSATHEVLELLEADGVSRDSVVLAHMDRNLDPGLWADLTASGAYLGMDGMARHRDAPDSTIIKAISALIDAGGERRILLGGDVGRASRYLAYGGMPGLGYLQRRFIPRLEDAVGADAVRTMQVDNPARLLTFIPRG